MTDEPFALKNDPPKPPRWKPRAGPRDRQLLLLSGLDCLPGQLDLIKVDGEPENETEGQQQKG